MAAYDLEQQEKLDDLKAWWARWGNTLMLAIIAACVAVIAVQGWRWYSDRQAAEASALFAGLTQASRANDLPKAKDAVAQLQERFGGGGYAPRASLILAKMLFDAKDTQGARKELQWVVDRGNEVELKEIARYRMAELLVHDKQYNEALALLDARHGAPFAGLYADLRGDALAAAGRVDEARAAYQVALGKFDVKSPYRNYLQVKLDAVGGALEAAPGAVAAPAGGASVAAPAPAAPAPAAPAPAAPAPAPGHDAGAPRK